MQIITKRATLVWQIPYATNGLVAYWDGEWNAPGGIHDAAATGLYELVSGQYETAFNETYTFTTGDNFCELVNFEYHGARRTALAAALAKAAGTRNIHLEVVAYTNVAGIYGNAFHMLGGSFGYNPATGNGGVNLFSSGWRTAKDASVVGAQAARLTIDIDFCSLALTYHVGTASVTSAIVKPESVPDSCCIFGTGTRIYCLRAYNRLPTPEEVAFNAEIDKARFGC